MADWTRREKTVTYVRYELSAPTNATELDKVIHAAARDRSEELGKTPADLYDDAMQVAVEDDKIVIWWEAELTC